MKVIQRPSPRLMAVLDRVQLTPNMVRVTVGGDWIKELSGGIEGAHFKLYLPEAGETERAFAVRLSEGPRPTVRTYTIRYIRPGLGEIDVDFVDHGDTGPASAWARRCRPGDVCGFGGPGPVKLKEFFADTYLVAADMSALPVAAATLEAMPRDATGQAFLEITDPMDQQDIDAPDGVALTWLIHPDPHEPPRQGLEIIRSLPRLRGVVQTCIAGESSMIRALREEIIVNRRIPKQNAYISGYWKIGLIEDEHQELKRSQAA